MSVVSVAFIISILLRLRSYCRQNVSGYCRPRTLLSVDSPHSSFQVIPCYRPDVRSGLQGNPVVQAYAESVYSSSYQCFPPTSAGFPLVLQSTF